MTGNLFAFTRAAAAHLADGAVFRLDSERALLGRTTGAGARAAYAAAHRLHAAIPGDLLARLVNAVVAQDAEPLFVLARIAGSALAEDLGASLAGGLHRACVENGCALAAFESDDVPEAYAPGRFDLSAAIVGRLRMPHGRVPAGHAGAARSAPAEDVDESAAAPLDVDAVRSGDAIVGLFDPSVGPHGFALLAASKAIDGDPAAMLVAQPSYRDDLRAIRARCAVRSIAYVEHSLYDDVPRALPVALAAVFEPARWDPPPAVAHVVAAAALAHDAAFRALPMGIGMVLLVPLADVTKALSASARARVVGFVQPRRAGEPPVVVRAPRAPR